jgi:hypothetical protein
MMNKASNFLDNNVAVISWLGLLCLIVYTSSFHNGFLMDDYPMLLDNHSFGIMEFVQLKGDGRGQVYFRPMYHLLNVISVEFFGKNVLFYHLLNLFLFYVSGLILYRVLSIVLQRKDIAFLAVMFFFVHPINSLLVNYKNTTGLSLLLLAVNYSLLNYLKAVLEKERSGHVLGLIWLVIALLCHETALIFPLFLAGTLFFTQRVTLKQIILTLIAPAVLGGGYVLFRSYHIGLALNTVANANKLHLSALTYIASLSKLTFWYLQKLTFTQEQLMNFTITF